MPSGQSPPRIRPGPGKAAARRHQRYGQPGQPSAATRNVPPLETDLDAPSPRGNRRRTVGPCRARVRCPARRPRPRPRAESRRGLLRSKPSSPHIDRASTACAAVILGAVKKARPRLRRSPSSSTVPCTRHVIRPAAPSLRLLESDRMQPVARQRGSVQPVAACAVRSGIVHRKKNMFSRKGRRR